jgi:hypothetical protein
MYAARVRSILVVDKGEGDPVGDAYKITIKDVEKMSDAELEQTATAQAESLRPYMPSYDSFVDHCDRIVNRAVREDKGLKIQPDGSR